MAENTELPIVEVQEGEEKKTGGEDDRSRKRQRRLLQNRQSAALSRQRKKEYILGLERKIIVLENEVSRLTQRNQELESVWKKEIVVTDTEGNATKISFNSINAINASNINSIATAASDETLKAQDENENPHEKQSEEVTTELVES